ncbi:MAG: SDR family oxidoreductase [Rhizomicrobium sp.]
MTAREPEGLEGRVFVVTGGTRGIGRATAATLHAQGAKLVTCSRRQADVDELNAAFASDRLAAVVADVSRPADVEGLCRFAIEKFGTIDGLVSNAGSACVSSALEAREEEILYQLQARLLATWTLVRGALVQLKKSRRSSIVIVAGAAGVDPTAMLAIPGVVNAGLLNLSRTLADELAEYGVRVNVVNPGTLDTRLGQDVIDAYAEKTGIDPEVLRDEMTSNLPLGRLPVPQDIANAIVFLLSDRAAMLTGNTLTPDGGILIRRARG